MESNYKIDVTLKFVIIIAPKLSKGLGGRQQSTWTKMAISPRNTFKMC
jgi:hypothetical protein